MPCTPYIQMRSEAMGWTKWPTLRKADWRFEPGFAHCTTQLLTTMLTRSLCILYTQHRTHVAVWQSSHARPTCQRISVTTLTRTLTQVQRQCHCHCRCCDDYCQYHYNDSASVQAHDVTLMTQLHLSRSSCRHLLFTRPTQQCDQTRGKGHRYSLSFTGCILYVNLFSMQLPFSMCENESRQKD